MATDPSAYALYAKPPSPEVAALLDEMARKARAPKKPRKARRKPVPKAEAPQPLPHIDRSHHILATVQERLASESPPMLYADWTAQPTAGAQLSEMGGTTGDRKRRYIRRLTPAPAA